MNEHKDKRSGEAGDEEDDRGWLVLLIAGMVGGAAALHYGKKGMDRVINGPSGALSPNRAKVFAALARVVPSAYGDARFAELAPDYKPDDERVAQGFTTCAYLPAYVGKAIGVATRYGTEALRTVGRAHGAWVEPGGNRRPRPGDLYATQDGSGAIVHVGIIVKADGTTWQTADAGQGTRGTGQRADYVTRTFDPQTLTLTGPTGQVRRLAGWYDVDRAPPPPRPAGVSGGRW